MGMSIKDIMIKILEEALKAVTLKQSNDSISGRVEALEREQATHRLNLALRDLTQLASHKFGDAFKSSGLAINDTAAAVQGVLASTLVTDPDERDHLVACFQDSAEYCDVQVALKKVKVPGKTPGKLVTAYAPALTHDDFLKVLAPLFAVCLRFSGFAPDLGPGRRGVGNLNQPHAHCPEG